MTRNDNPSHEAAEVRRIAEEKVREKAGRSQKHLESLSPEKIRQALHELEVHQVELKTQNEELRRAHDELAASRTRHFDLYNLAPVGYCTISPKGLFLEANLTAANLGGARECAGREAGFPVHRERRPEYLLSPPETTR